MTMQIKNIEYGLRKTMVAVFKKQGMSDQEATAKATKNLDGALSTFRDAQARSAATSQVRSSFERFSTAKVVAQNGKVKGKAEKAAKAEKENDGRKRGPSIKTNSKKITSAEQVALHKVKTAKMTMGFLAAKTSASVAIALGAVATWAKTLPVDPSPVIPQDSPADTQPDPAPDAAPEPATPDPSKNKKSFRGSARRDPR